MKTIFESRNIIIALLTLVLSLAVWTYKGDQADIHKSNEAVKTTMKEGFESMKESMKGLSMNMKDLSSEQRTTALEVARLKAIREAESNARRNTDR